MNFKNEFVDSLPWNSFGRKNVGYLFAIARGAKVIWDFDDDNFLKFWIDGASPDKNLDINSFTDLNCKYSARRLIGSRIIESAVYCNQILLVPLYLNSTQNTSVN